MADLRLPPQVTFPVRWQKTPTSSPDTEAHLRRRQCQPSGPWHSQSPQQSGLAGSGSPVSPPLDSARAGLLFPQSLFWLYHLPQHHPGRDTEPSGKRGRETDKQGRMLWSPRKWGPSGVGCSPRVRTLPSQAAFSLVPKPLTPSSEPLLCPWSCQRMPPPSWAQSHAPMRWERGGGIGAQIFLPNSPFPTPPLQRGLKPHCPVCCHRPSSALSQGRADAHCT